MAATHDHNRPNTDYEQDSELEQYGVWVKAGPEDVDENDAEDDAYTLTDLGEDEPFEDPDADLLGIGDDLGEADLADDFAEAAPSEAIEPIVEQAADQAEDADEAALDMEAASDDDLLDLDDDDFSISLDEPEEDRARDSEIDLEELPEALDELDLDELPEALEEPELEELPQALDELEPDELSDAGELADPVDIESVEDKTGVPDLAPELEVLGFDEADEESESESEPEPAEPATTGDEEPATTDQDDLELDLENLDLESFEESAQDDELWTDSAGGSPTPEPEEGEEGLDLGAVGLGDDLQDDGEPDLGAVGLGDDLQDDGEPDLGAVGLGDDLQDDDEDDTEIAEIDLSALDDDELDLDEDSPEALDNLDDDIPDLELEDEASEDIHLGDSFDDLSAVEDEMTAPQEEPYPAEGDESRSVSLLESIEQELGTIRTELSELKRELSRLRATPQGPAEAGTDEAVAQEPAEENESGFFEDEGDDDETIALTGAELDNIMNTAEFTEQPGRPTDIDDARGEPVRSEDGLTHDDASQPVTDIALEDAPEDTDILDLDLDLPDDEDPGTGRLAQTESEMDYAGDEDLLAGFEGSQEEVDALASMDIDAELASIEELEDTSPPPASGSDAADEPPAFGDDETEGALPADDEEMLVEELDLEPFDLEPLSETLDDEPPDVEAPLSEARDDEDTADGPLFDDDADIEDGMSFDLEPLDETGSETPLREARENDTPDDAEDRGAADEPDIDELMADVTELDELTPDEAELEELPFDEADVPESSGEEPPLAEPTVERDEAGERSMGIPENLKGELRSVLNYMDKLLDSLPEEKIQEFAASEHFKVYKRLFEELGLEQ